EPQTIGKPGPKPDDPIIGTPTQFIGIGISKSSSNIGVKKTGFPDEFIEVIAQSSIDTEIIDFLTVYTAIDKLTYLIFIVSPYRLYSKPTLKISSDTQPRRK